MGAARPSEMDEDEALLIEANACARERLADFVQMAWPLLNPGVPLIWGRHLDAVCEHLEAVTRREIRQLAINIPPGETKTTSVCQCWPSWEWLQFPERRWLFAAHSQANTIRDSLARRGLIQGSWYQDAFHPAWRIVTGEDTKLFFGNDRKGWHKAISVGTRITGWHADTQVIDDPLDAADVHTVELEHHVRWYRDVFESRVRDGFARVLIMQRLHHKDLAGELLRAGGWEHLCLPRRFEPKRRCETACRTCSTGATSIGWRDWRTKPGELLNPERFDEAALAEKYRGKPAAVIAAQEQQTPTVGEGAIFRESWWRFWTWDGATPGTRALPTKFDRLVGFFDTTFDGGQSADYFVGTLWGQVGADFFLLDRTRLRATFTEAKREMRRFVERWPECRRWLVEQSANGPALVDELRSIVPGLILVKVTEPKVQRAESISGYVEAGNIYLPHETIAPWVRSEWIPEFNEFPRGTHDDQVDSCSGALRDMTRRGRPAAQPVAPPPTAPRPGLLEAALRDERLAEFNRKAAKQARREILARRKRERREGPKPTRFSLERGIEDGD
jgi:predicted phage terminase large subunit-like protein